MRLKKSAQKIRTKAGFKKLLERLLDWPQIIPEMDGLSCSRLKSWMAVDALRSFSNRVTIQIPLKNDCNLSIDSGDT